ncbi:peptidylprolyl isomerase [Sphingomonas sp. CARO-RG-8B-R24-01]|uniref:peptidylprolyl isomerase n=1 Tax=Sphingomonas sp. CARO-RG-8B-R24-01 TaxID=2914831 RepID=UPI002412E260|nr:peptidylprolyl isomerase [Sphingomonas sp. CARO-RG-8B-R24-01]
MLSFFRRMIRHPLGGAVALGFVALLGLAFVLSDHSGQSAGSTVNAADVAVKVGSKTITISELRAAVARDVDSYRQQQPTLDTQQFVAGGGFEATLERLIDSTAFRQYAQAQGMVVSKRAVDGLIASQPGLAGLDGKFSQEKYEQVLRQIGMTDADVRLQTTDQILTRQLLLSPIQAKQVPAGLAVPYANLLLEKRSGQIGFIPAAALAAGPAPTDAELTTFYARNLGKYRLPERRIIRYATVTPASVAGQATPSDADIAAAYRAQAQKFAAAELRTIVQVVVGDQAAANALVAKVRGGTSIEQAARAAGLEPATIKDTQKAAFAGQSSPEIANAVFAAKAGDVVGPLRAPLGFVVAKITTVRTQAAKSLAEATPELKAALAPQRTTALLTEKRNAFDDALGKTSFDGIVAKNQLTAQSTQPLTATGQNVDTPTVKPDPALTPILAAAFAASPGDQPQTVPLGPDGSFALVTLEKVIPAAPRPLAQIRETVVRDFQLSRAERAAHDVAAKVVAAANAGTPLSQALAATGLKLPPLQPVTGPRAALIGNPQRVPPPLALMFAMAAKSTKLLEAPDKSGWVIVHLDSITPGNAQGNAKVITGTQSDIGNVVGREYVTQFGKAVQNAIGTSRNAKAIASLKAELLGITSASQP